MEEDGQLHELAVVEGGSMLGIELEHAPQVGQRVVISLWLAVVVSEDTPPPICYLLLMLCPKQSLLQLCPSLLHCSFIIHKCYNSVIV